MTIQEYKQQFIKLYEQICEEHGPVRYILIQDNTKIHRNQIEIDGKWIDCDIRF